MYYLESAIGSCSCQNSLVFAAVPARIVWCLLLLLLVDELGIEEEAYFCMETSGQLHQFLKAESLYIL